MFDRDCTSDMTHIYVYLLPVESVISDISI